MTQERLFYESELEALRDDVNALGEQAQLVRVVQEASETLKHATERLDRLARAPLAAVPGGKSA